MQKWRQHIGLGLTFIWLAFLGQSALHPIADHFEEQEHAHSCSSHFEVEPAAPDPGISALSPSEDFHCQVCDLLAALTSYISFQAYSSPFQHFAEVAVLPVVEGVSAYKAYAEVSRGPPAVL